MDWTDWIDEASLTDVGRHRPTNQDAFAVSLAADLPMFVDRGHVFMVADGMGAHAAGELASRMAVDRIPLTYHKYVKAIPQEALIMAIQTANEEVNRRGQLNLDFAGMGTTVAALVVHPESAVIAYVGDSRVYRIRGQAISQLTRDHSLAWELVARGRLRPDQVEAFGAKNVITRSLGPETQVYPDLLGPFPVEEGDVFVLCSDGLSGPVDGAEIGLLVNHLPPDQACQALVTLANARGGADNITVQIVRIKKTGMPDLAPEHLPPAHQGAAKQPSDVVQRMWQRPFAMGLAFGGLCAAYVAVAIALAMAGVSIWLAVGGGAVLALVLGWLINQGARSHVDNGPMDVEPHDEAAAVLTPEALEPIEAACRDLLADGQEILTAENLQEYEDLLSQARQHVGAGRLEVALECYAEALLAEPLRIAIRQPVQLTQSGDVVATLQQANDEDEDETSDDATES